MKKNTILYIITTIVLIVIAVGTTYIIMNNKNNEEITEPSNNDNNQEEQVLKDSITLKNTYQEGNNIIQEYQVVLNGKERNMNIIYTQEKDELGIETITGSLGNETLYLDMYDTPNEETAFDINRINKNFNEQNFQIMRSSDNKNYLSIVTMLNYPTGIKMNYEIFNDNLNKLNQESIPLYTSMQCINSNLEIEPFENVYVELYNLNNENSCHRIRGKIENNQIYSLLYNYDETLQHRVYTIHNDKVEYQVLRTFKNLIISGEV